MALPTGRSRAANRARFVEDVEDIIISPEDILTSPSGAVLPVGVTAAQINALIREMATEATKDQPKTITLAAGTFRFTDNVDLASHVYLTGSGRYGTRIISTVTGGDDDPTNGYGCSLSHARVIDCVGADMEDCGAWFHDHFAMRVSDVEVRSSDPANPMTVGMRVHDCSGTFEKLISTFVRYGMICENDASSCTLRDVTLNPTTPANGAVAALYFDSITGRGMRFEGLIFGNAGFTPMFAFGPGFTPGAAEQWELLNVKTDATGVIQRAGRVFFAYQPDNHVLTFGQLAELQASSPAGEVHVRPPNSGIGTDPTTRAAVVLQGKNFGGSGWCALQATDSEFFVYVTGAHAPGDAVRPADPTGADNQWVIVDNAPVDLDRYRACIGKIRSPAAAGSGYAQVQGKGA